MEEGTRSDGDQHSTDQSTGRMLTVTEAAETLGISADAVRSRIKRGTLQTVRESGRVFVVLVETDRTRSTNNQDATDRTTYDLRDQVHYLREQLRREQEAHAEARRIIAGLVQRIPELEAPAQESPTEARESSESPGPTRTPTATGSPQTTAQRPWWRRIFG